MSSSEDMTAGGTVIEASGVAPMVSSGSELFSKTGAPARTSLPRAAVHGREPEVGEDLVAGPDSTFTWEEGSDDLLSICIIVCDTQCRRHGDR